MRRRYYNNRKSESDFGVFFELLFDTTSKLPWWLGLIGGAIFYFVLGYFYSKYNSSKDLASLVSAYIAFFLQYLLSIACVLGAIVSAINEYRNKKRYDQFSSVSDVRDVTEILSKMKWDEFEMLIGEYFRRQGFDVEQKGGAQADGGIDIELRKGNDLYLVQCKHYWRNVSGVPETVARDFYGTIQSRGAAGGYLVTSGHFTSYLKEFSEGRGIILIDGNDLRDTLGKILETRNGNQSKGKHGEEEAVNPLLCPKCNSVMILRTAGKGRNLGNKFWGCSKYPNCNGIINV